MRCGQLERNGFPFFFSSLPSWTLESGKLATAVSHWSSLPVVLLVRQAQVNRKGENELGLCLLRSLHSQEVFARLCQGFSASMNGGYFLTILPGGFLISSVEAGVMVAGGHSEKARSTQCLYLWLSGQIL